MLIKVKDLRKFFPVRRSLSDVLRGRPRKFIRAVNGLNFNIMENEVFCLAGESGCGKSTTGRLLVRLLEPTSGEVLFQGENIYEIPREQFKDYRKKMQIIFQDPYESLNLRMTVYDLIEEPLSIHEIGSKEERFDMVYQALEDVGLEPPEDFMIRYPHQLSGGERQRVAIARALVLKPKFVVADEPVSMLDVSVRAGILKLMLDLKEKYGLTYFLITHDLSVAYHVCDRIAIMYAGKIVEIGPADSVILEPMHPYTKALVDALPKIGRRSEAPPRTTPIRGEVPSPIDLPSGCLFYPRCIDRFDLCEKEEPPLVEVSKDRYVACHLYK